MRQTSTQEIHEGELELTQEEEASSIQALAVIERDADLPALDAGPRAIGKWEPGQPGLPTPQLDNTPPGHLIYCTIPDDGTRASKIARYNAMNCRARQIAEVEEARAPFEVAHIACHKVVLTGEDGETLQAIRTVLIASDGSAVATTANGVLSSLQKIESVLGPAEDWHLEPIRVSARMERTRKGYRTLVLDVIP